MAQLLHHRLESEIASLAGDPRVVLLPPPCPITVQPNDFSHADELIDDGYREAVRTLDAVRGEPARLDRRCSNRPLAA